jgi:hypothetical protein
VRESPNDSTLAGGEGQGSRGETCHPHYCESSVSSMAEHPLLQIYDKVQLTSKYKIFNLKYRLMFPVIYNHSIAKDYD